MSTDTRIEWATKTWSPLLGCSRVSPGCDNCYAIRTVHRLSHNPSPKVGPLYQGLTRREDGELDWTDAVVTIPERLADPFKWRKPQRVFVNSQSDLFHAYVPVEFIAQVFAVMAATPRHTFQILTKRHARMRSVLSDPEFQTLVTVTGHREKWGWPAEAEFPSRLSWPLTNVHLGVSAESQQWADIRIPALIETPDVVPWVSLEPLLGPIDLSPWLDRLAWVVLGGESGPGARPMDLEWAEQIVRQCQAACVPVLVKQLGTVAGGREHHDIESFPEALRVREYPGEVSS